MTRNHAQATTALLVALALAACGKSKGSDQTQDSPPDDQAAHVKFTAPTAGARLHGLAQLQLESNLEDEEVRLALSVDDVPVVEFDQLALAIQLDTTRFDDGAHSLRLEARARDGSVYTDRVSVELDNPAHRFVAASLDQRAYGRGEAIEMQLEYTHAGLDVKPDFSVLDAAFSPSNVDVDDMGDGRYVVRYTISENDERDPLEYEVPITSTGSDAPSLVVKVPVNFLGAPALPIDVSAPNAVFSDRTVPLLTTPTGPKLEFVEAPTRLIQGQPQVITVRWTASADDPVDHLALSSPDTSGTWVIPLGAPSVSGELTIPVKAAGSPSEITTKSIPVSAAAVGSSGTTGGAVLTDTDIITMNQVGLRFLLEWSTSADLDLEVTTPDGSAINFMSPSAQNGVLERDSNSLCASSEPVPLESIAWSAKDMIPGNYGIKVSQYDSCTASDTKYTVTILACGKVISVPGTFGRFDGSTIQEHVLPPYVMDCIHRVHGTIRYEKVIPGGLAKPLAVGIPVQLTGTGLSQPLSTTTNRDGEYSFVLTSPDVTINVGVTAMASWTPPQATVPSAQVWPLTQDRVYSVTSVIGALTALDVEHDVLITRNENSGAFSILDTLRRATNWKDSFFEDWAAAKIAPIVARWTRGSATPVLGGSYYSVRSIGGAYNINNMAVWLGGDPNNPSEFTDTVIAHEYSHHIAAALDFNTQHPPGANPNHNFDQRVAPYFAWLEGVATGLGQQIMNTPIYSTGNESAKAIVNIESGPRPTGDLTMGQAYGTLPAWDASGLVNEFLVAGILYDLLDPANEPGNDEIPETQYATKMTLSRYLNDKTKRVDRMGAGIDLVEFLDGWRCFQAYAAQYYGQTYSDVALAKLVKYREYEYTTPPTPTTCR